MTERNRSIDIFRYVCAIMVVAIHTHPFEDISHNLGYIFTQIIPRIAVPFFFTVSGYFYINGLEKGKQVFFPYVKRILKTYALWSSLYFAIDFIQWGHQNIKGFIAECIYTFFITGSHFHFWYFPALLFAVCVTTALYKSGCKKMLIPLSIVLYSIGCLGCSYWSLGVQIPILSSLFTSQYFVLIRRVILMGFPFFSAGLIVAKIEAYVKKRNISKCAMVLILLGVTGCWLFEIFVVVYFGLRKNIIVTFGLFLLTVTVMLFLLYFPMPQYRTLSQKCHTLADITYYSHPLIIMVLSFVANKVYGTEISQTPMFLSVLVLTYVLGCAINGYKKTRNE